MTMPGPHANACAATATTLLSRWASKAARSPASVDTAELLAQLQGHLEQVAFHYGNVQRYHQPELEGFSHDD